MKANPTDKIILEKRLKTESRLVRDDSMAVLKEFENIDFENIDP